MSVETPLVLSVDIGTSSLRVLVFDAQGKLVPQVGVQVAYEPQTTPDGGAFLEAEWLLTQTVQAINGVAEQLGDGHAPSLPSPLALSGTASWG
jgi:gluconokinase